MEYIPGSQIEINRSMERSEGNGHAPSLIILRGLPGSGKSRLAKVLSEGKYPVFSVDDYFTDPQTGDYKFNFEDNHKAYEECSNNIEAAMRNGIPKIFCDNVFSIDWEIETYFKLAKKYSYTIFVATVENYHGEKNIHLIPEEQIRKMAGKYKVKLM